MLIWDDYLQAIIAVLVITDPLGRPIFFAMLTRDMTKAERRKAALKVIVAVGLILGGSALVGQALLDAIDIHLGAFGVAGGFIVADMECGTSTVTLSRQEKVDFSNLVFVASGGLLVKSGSNIGAFADLARKKITVIPGTTTAKRLDEVLKERAINARLVHVGTAEEALSSLKSDKADAYASDRALLMGQVFLSGKPDDFNMLREQFSIGPYAFAVSRGDPDFRLAVNRSLADLYRTGEIGTVFSRSFGSDAKPTVLLSCRSLWHNVLCRLLTTALFVTTNGKPSRDLQAPLRQAPGLAFPY